MYNTKDITKQATTASKVQNKLMKFWATFSKAVDVPMDLKQEHWITLDSIIDRTDYNESNLLDELFQPNLLNKVGIEDIEDGEERYTIYTLSELIDLEDNEDIYGLRQFNVTPSRVGALAYEIMTDNRLYMPIRLGYVDSPSDAILVSGRHRKFALLAICSEIEGWEELQVTVKIKRYESAAELAKYIEVENGSRAMSSEEKLGLWYGKQNLDSTNTEDLFIPCNAALSNFNKAATLYFATKLEGVETLGLQPATLGKIGGSFAGKFRQTLPTNIRKFLKDADTAHEVCSTAVDAVVDNWNELKKVTREIHVDADGVEVVSYNVARKYAKVGEVLAAELAKAFVSQLSDKAEMAEAEKAAKQSANKKKAAERQRKELAKARELLESLGAQVELPEGVKVEAVA